MNITLFEIKRNLRTTLIWSIIVTIVGLLYLAMGPTFIEQSESLIALMSGMGDVFLDGLGINLDTFFSPVGYYAYIGGFITLALCVQAMIYGMKAFVVEKNTKSIEFLYTKPSSRIKIFIQKYLANIVLLTITQVIVIASLYFATDIINDVDYDHTLMFLMLFTIVPLQYLFFTLGTVIGTAVNRLKIVVPIAIMSTVVMYFLNMLEGIVGNDVMGYISFFNYYNLSEIVFNEGYDLTYVGISLVLIALFTVLSMVLFKIRDMKVI